MPVQKVTEKEIIKAALPVFKSKGYNNASMTDLAEACGLMKGSMYHYFASKEDLMIAVIRYLHQKYRERVFQWAYLPGLTALEKIHHFQKFSEELFLHSPDGCLMGNIALEVSNSHPKLVVDIRAFFDDWIAAMAEIYSEIYEIEEALLRARQSVAEIEGAVMLKRIYGDNKPIMEVHARIKKPFIKLKPEAL